MHLSFFAVPKEIIEREKFSDPGPGARVRRKSSAELRGGLSKVLFRGGPSEKVFCGGPAEDLFSGALLKVLRGAPRSTFERALSEVLRRIGIR